MYHYDHRTFVEHPDSMRNTDSDFVEIQGNSVRRGKNTPLVGRPFPKSLKRSLLDQFIVADQYMFSDDMPSSSS